MPGAPQSPVWPASLPAPASRPAACVTTGASDAAVACLTCVAAGAGATAAACVTMGASGSSGLGGGAAGASLLVATVDAGGLGGVAATAVLGAGSVWRRVGSRGSLAERLTLAVEAATSDAS